MSEQTNRSSLVSLRERVKSPPAQAIVDSYFAPSVAAGCAFSLNRKPASIRRMP